MSIFPQEHPQVPEGVGENYKEGMQESDEHLDFERQTRNTRLAKSESHGAPGIVEELRSIRP